MTRTNSKGIPFRYDQVGSLLRPETLKEARAKYSKDEIEKSELTEIENIEITRIIAKQKDKVYNSCEWYFNNISSLGILKILLKYYNIRKELFALSK